MPCDSNNSQQIEKIVGTSVDNLVSQILLKFQDDRIKIVRVLQLVVLKNAVFRKTRLEVKSLPTYSLRRSTRNTVTLQIKYL